MMLKNNMYVLLILVVGVVKLTGGASHAGFKPVVLKDVLQHSDAATKHTDAEYNSEKHSSTNSLPSSENDWVSLILSDFKDSLKSKLAEQMKADLKQEFMKVILEELAAELKEDMRNGVLDLKSYTTDVFQTKEDIKGYLVKGIMSEARSDVEKVSVVDFERTSSVKNTNQKISSNVNKSSSLIGNVSANRTIQYLYNSNGSVIAKDNVNSAENVLEAGTPSTKLSIKNKRETPLLSNTTPSNTHSDSRKIAFTTFLDHYVDHMPVKTKLIFNRILLNDGNGYDVTTGVFTVPVSGVYLFSLHLMSHRGSTELTLVVDSVHQVDTTIEHHDNAYYSVQSGNMCLIRAHRGQSVWVETVHVGQGAVEGQEGYRDSTFAGVLLYADQ